MELAQSVIQHHARGRSVGHHDQVEVAIIVNVESGERGGVTGGTDQRLGVRPWLKRQRKPGSCRQIRRGDRHRGPVVFGTARDRLGLANVAKRGTDDARDGLVSKRPTSVFGVCEIDEVEVEVSVLVEVEPAGRQAERRGALEPRLGGDVFETSSPHISKHAVAARAGQDEIDATIGVEALRLRRAERDEGVGQTARTGDVFIRSVAFVDQQGVANTAGATNRGGEKQVGAAVAVGVKRDDRCPKPCTCAAHHRERADEVVGAGPPFAFQKRDPYRSRHFKMRRRAFWGRSLVRVKRIDDLGVFAGLAVKRLGHLARRRGIGPGIQRSPARQKLRLLIGLMGPAIGLLQFIQSGDEIRVAIERLGIKLDQGFRLLGSGGLTGMARRRERGTDFEPRVAVGRVAVGHEPEVLVCVGRPSLAEELEDQAAAIVGVEILGVAGDHIIEQIDCRVEARELPCTGLFLRCLGLAPRIVKKRNRQVDRPGNPTRRFASNLSKGLRRSAIFVLFHQTKTAEMSPDDRVELSAGDLVPETVCAPCAVFRGRGEARLRLGCRPCSTRRQAQSEHRNKDRGFARTRSHCCDGQPALRSTATLGRQPSIRWNTWPV